MGIAGGPDITTSGLVLELDAADKNSYPGSGTAWTDISGNGNNGTLTNGPTFSTVCGGAIVFDGTDDYVNVSSFSLNPNTNGFTYDAVITSTTANTSYPSWRVPIGIGGGSNFYGILVEGDTRGFRLDVPDTSGNRIGVTTGINIAANINTQVTWTWLNGLFKLYINGTLQSSSNQGAYSAPSITSLRLGTGVNVSNLTWYGNQYLVRFYNRTLSDSEILQNYNAIKTRFGL